MKEMKKYLVWSLLPAVLFLTLAANAAVAAPSFYRAEVGDWRLDVRQGTNPIALTCTLGGGSATAEVDSTSMHAQVEGCGFLHGFPEQRYRFTATGSTFYIRFDYSLRAQAVLGENPSEYDWAEGDAYFGLVLLPEETSWLYRSLTNYRDAGTGGTNEPLTDEDSVEKTFALEVGRYYDLCLYTWAEAGAYGAPSYGKGVADLSNITVLYSGIPGPVPPPIVPIPGAVWLLGSGLVGLLGFARRRA